MSPTDPAPRNRPGDSGDPLLQRYHEANAHDGARPAERLRAAVLERARQQPHAHPAVHPMPSMPPAANDSRWAWRALGGVATLGLVALLFLEFERSAPEQRDRALGARSPTPSGVPAAEGPASSAGAVQQNESLRAPAAPAPIPSLEQSAPPSAAAETSDDLPRPAAEAPAQPPAPAPALTRPLWPQRAEEALEAAPPSPRSAPSTKPPSEPPSAPTTGAVGDAGVGAGAPQRQRVETSPAQEPLAAEPLAALLRATAAGNVAEVRDAIARGDNLEASDAQGRTALMIAAQRGNVALVRLLRAAGADASRTDADGRTAADLARLGGHGEVLEALQQAPVPALVPAPVPAPVPSR